MLDHGSFVLPTSAEVIGWTDESGIELDVAVAVSLPCAAIDEFLIASGLADASTSYPTESDWVGQQAEQLGWRLDRLRQPKAWVDYVSERNYYREVVAGSWGRRPECHLYLTAYSF